MMTSNTNKNLTLGSLFDGIGGFPLAAMRHGITPVWASEIEAAPISITKRHFPDMKHYGDITGINGAGIEPVDIITFGSPCQDLSVAGKRAGLDGEKSGLFMEAIRIIREMREKTDEKYPARIIWENVDGAFSSNKGEDFRTVIEEIASLAEPGVFIPGPPGKEGKIVWQSAGAIVGDGWSLAWRTMDAEYWGVPQRRYRIFLVADFGSERAAEMLFKPEGLPGDSAESGTAGEGVAGDSKDSIRAAGFNGWRIVSGTIEYETDRAPCIQSNMPPDVVIPINTQIATRHNALGERTGLGVGKEGDPAFTLQEGHHHAVAVHQKQCGEVRVGEVANTLSTNANASGRNAPLVAIGVDSEMNALAEKAGTMRAHGSGGAEQFVATVDCRNHRINENLSGTLQAKNNGGQSLNYINPVVTFAMQGFGDYKESDRASTMKSRDGKDSTDLICINGGICDAETETGCREILLKLWDKAIQETLRKRETRGKQPFQSAEILRHEMYGGVHEEESGFDRDENDQAGTLDGTTGKKCRCLRNLWEAECKRCASQGQKYQQQSDGKSPKGLSELPQQNTSPKAVMQNMREADEGLRILRETLPAIQKAWKPLCRQKEPEQPHYIVRRLTVVECERLMGYPDGYTAYGHDGKKISDSARYRALGNSLAIPCVDRVFAGIISVEQHLAKFPKMYHD
jgi:DNA (cytosine-5)-methyltransferase 1